MNNTDGELTRNGVHVYDVQKGVEAAFHSWINQYPISIPDRIEGAVSSAFADWLEEHTVELIHAIAEKVAKQQVP